MDNFFARFGTLMMVVLPIAFVWNLVRDLAHPEWWGDWTHNPYVYGSLGLLMLAVVLLYALYILWDVRRMDRALREQAARLAILRKTLNK